MKTNSCIMVTGANGLAGSAVVENLRRDHTCVVPVTRADADLRHPDEALELFTVVKPDVVFHAAATVYGLQGNMDNQFKAVMDNTMINTAVVGSAHALRVKHFIAMGTNAVYPASSPVPYRVETIFDGRPHEAEMGYAHAKRHMLAMLEASDMKYTYLVSGNLYGPRDTFDPIGGHVLPSMIHKFYEASIDPSKTVDLWGTGEARRDFLYSEDLAEIVRAVLYQEHSSGPMNIGNGRNYQLRDISYILASISGVGYDRVRWDETKPTGRLVTYSDLGALMWFDRPLQTGITEGLRKTFEWYKADRARAHA